MSWDPVGYLKTRHTKVLLKLRDACRMYHGTYNVGEPHERHQITVEQVLSELNTREHIPGKSEMKLLRRLMAKNKMTEKQVREVPKFATLLAQAQYRRVVDADTYNLYKEAAPDCWVTKKMLVLKT